MIPDASRRSRTGAGLLVVEDSFPVAAGLELLLESAGYAVAGKAGNVRRALDLVADVPFDVALLDIDLRGEHVAPVADAVRRQGKPIIFLSGYGGADTLPPHLQAHPRLEKPIDPDELLATLERVVAATLDD